MTRIPQVEGVILGPVSHYEYPPAKKEGSIRRGIKDLFAAWEHLRWLRAT